jgi:hypothetical protein
LNEEINNIFDLLFAGAMFEREAKRERILEALNREKRFVASCSSGQGHWGKKPRNYE